MNPQLKMLVWKQWRERRDQFVLCLTFVVVPSIFWTMALLVQGLIRGKHPDAVSWAFLVWLYSILMPIFVAMRTSWSESTERIAAFTRGLPVKPRQASWIQLAGGAATLAGPVPLLAIFASVTFLGLSPIAPQLLAQLSFILPTTWAQVGQLWLFTLVIVVTTIATFLQFSLIGTFLRTENRLAFFAAAWTILMLYCGIMQSNAELHLGWLQAAFPQVLSLTAFNWLGGIPVAGYDFSSVSQLAGLLSASLAVMAVLAVWFVHRQSRRLAQVSLPGVGWLPTCVASLRWRFAWRWSPLAGRLSTRATALVWLALRQAMPMCLAGLAIAILLCLMELMSGGRRSVRTAEFWGAAAQSLRYLMIVVGFVWASVVGAGSMADELDTRCGDFWRTRPVPLWWLFTVKFLVGLAAVWLVLDGAAVAAVWLAPAEPRFRYSDWAYIYCFFPLHAAMFAVAVAWACVLRRMALAAMAAVVSYAVIYFSFQQSAAASDFAPLETFERLVQDATVTGVIDLTSRGYPILAVVLGSAIVVSFLVAGFSLARYQPKRLFD